MKYIKAIALAEGRIFLHRLFIGIRAILRRIAIWTLRRRFRQIVRDYPLKEIPEAIQGEFEQYSFLFD